VQAFGTVAADGETTEARDARTARDEAEARLALATQQLRRLEALAASAIAPRKELEAAQAEYVAAQAAATRARQALGAFGGGAARATLDAGETWVVAEVLQRDLALVTAGATVRFAPDAIADRRFAGRVDASPGYVDPRTHLAPVRLRLRDADGALRPGLTGAVAIEVGMPRPAVMVPEAAVVFDGGQALVFAEESPGKFTPHPVRIGVTRDGAVEIAEGLEAGARVATTGAASLLSALRLPAAEHE
jgi:multidrug efflux pump subunit AcrA (membrane-fusion protein)